MTAVDTLLTRLDSGEWGGTVNPFTMNTRAQGLNLGAARFTAYRPEVFQRAFDGCDLQAVLKKPGSPRTAKSASCKRYRAAKAVGG